MSDEQLCELRQRLEAIRIHRAEAQRMEREMEAAVFARERQLKADHEAAEKAARARAGAPEWSNIPLDDNGLALIIDEAVAAILRQATLNEQLETVRHAIELAWKTATDLENYRHSR